MKIIKPIPTVIVTGFLGSGKTSLITQWMKQKPDHETWGILVNEYGEKGIDGTWLAGVKRTDEKVYVKEVPGGCMCCASHLLAQVALNQLIQQTTPDRLIIEPSGLGHPVELINQLASPHYQQILQVNAVITLLDARRLADARVTSHALFMQQLEMADVIVASKSDRYTVNDQTRLSAFLAKQGLNEKPLVMSDSRGIALDVLFQQRRVRRGNTRVTPMPAITEAHGNVPDEAIETSCITFEHDVLFSLKRIIRWMDNATYMRLKAVVITDEGIVAVNHVEGETSYAWFDEASCSQFEVIDERLDDFRDAVMACRLESGDVFAPTIGCEQ